ncbi:NADH pyrophosphatase NudC (nudix superfamily) [Clostridium beijerinckii]|nr:NADH pyrophosphatase NudC (nudix superfamily) [Clostridium beijerinckii]
MYSLIAGFVEAGEDLESTVKREVFEEVGIKVKNIKYYKSSPWSFPNSLMLGFFAEYESGEIKVDGKEIVDAQWFSQESFPNIPKKFTLARKLIDEFIEKIK